MSIIVCDVDGTVCHSCQVMSDEVADAIAALPDHFMFLSGTDHRSLVKMVWCPLANRKKHCFLLGNSGAVCPLPDKEKVIAELTKAVEELNLHCLSGKNDQILDRGTQVTLSCLGRGAPEDKKKSFDPDGRRRRNIINVLSARLPDHSLVIGGTTSIDVVPKGFNKAVGLRTYLELLEIKPHTVCYYGDQFDPEGNDYPLLSYVPCVKVNGPDEFLKAMLDRRK